MNNRYLIILLFLSSVCFAVVGDFDSDGIVGANDVNTFTDYWLASPVADPNCDLDEDGSVNFIDFAMMAQNYAGGLTSSPHVNTEPTIPAPPDINTPVFEDYYCTLTGNDADGDELTYIITALPAHGWLYDPVDWSTGPLFASSLPYVVGNVDNTIVYRGSDVGLDSFDYKVFDGEAYSSNATVDVNLVVNSLDSLTFDGSNYAVFDDNDIYDCVDGFGLVFFYRTTKSDCVILNKISNGTGYSASLVGGYFRVNFYYNNQLVVSKQSFAPRTDTGRWYVGSISYNNGASAMWQYAVENDEGWDVGQDFTIPVHDYTNDANMYIAKTDVGYWYEGEFDRLRFYDGANGIGLDLKLLFVMSPDYEPREDSGVGTGLSGDINPLARFMFSEGADTTVTDGFATPNLTGTISDGWAANAGNTVKTIILADRYNFKMQQNTYDNITATLDGENWKNTVKDNQNINSRARY